MGRRRRKEPDGVINLATLIPADLLATVQSFTCGVLVWIPRPGHEYGAGEIARLRVAKRRVARDAAIIKGYEKSKSISEAARQADVCRNTATRVIREYLKRKDAAR